MDAGGLAWGFFRGGKLLHASLSNVPVAEWANAKTMCWRTGPYYRFPTGEEAFMQKCKTCLSEAQVGGRPKKQKSSKLGTHLKYHKAAADHPNCEHCKEVLIKRDAAGRSQEPQRSQSW